MGFEYISSLATECGIFENDEILAAIRFLNDLGSIQYFERNGLKDRVVIDPQVFLAFFMILFKLRFLSGL